MALETLVRIFKRSPEEQARKRTLEAQEAELKRKQTKLDADLLDLFSNKVESITGNNVEKWEEKLPTLAGRYPDLEGQQLERIRFYLTDFQTSIKSTSSVKFNLKFSHSELVGFHHLGEPDARMAGNISSGQTIRLNRYIRDKAKEDRGPRFDVFSEITQFLIASRDQQRTTISSQA